MSIESGVVTDSYNLWPPIITQRREEMGSLNHNDEDFTEGFSADVLETVRCLPASSDANDSAGTHLHGCSHPHPHLPTLMCI